MAAGRRNKSGLFPPSFFKVIRDPSAPHLSLPNAFVTRYSDKIPKNPTLVSEKGGRSWRLETVKIGEDYCFVNGWEKLVKDVRLCSRDIVLFWLVDPNTFRVFFLDANGCDKDLPFSQFNDDDHDDDDDDEDEEAQDADFADDDDDDDDEEEDEEAEDADFESELHDEVKKPGRKLSFQKVISMKTHKYGMSLPVTFVRAAGIQHVPIVKVKDHEGMEWGMRLMRDRHDSAKYRLRRYRLGTGWANFRVYHNLSDGDVCKFWFNKHEGVLILTHLFKSKRPAKQETPKVENEWYPIEKPGSGGSKPGSGGGGGVTVKTKYELGHEEKVAERKREWVPVEVKIEDELDPGMVAVKRKTGMSPPEKPPGSGGISGGVKVKTKYESGREVEVAERKREWVPVEVKIEDEADPGMVAVKRKMGMSPPEKPPVVAVKRKTGMSPPEKPPVSGAEQVFRRKHVIYF